MGAALPKAAHQQPPAGAQGLAAAPGSAVVKQHIGTWAICQDQQGEYYHNSATHTSYDEPPPELQALMQQNNLQPQHAQQQPQVPYQAQQQGGAYPKLAPQQAP